VAALAMASNGRRCRSWGCCCLGAYQIVRRLPTAEGEFQYVIRSAYEDHQRVAKESELSHA
jgi:hypothetical protein